MSDSFAPSESSGARSSFEARPQDLRINGALSAETPSSGGRTPVFGARIVVAVLCAAALAVGHFAPAFARALILF